MSFTSLMVDEDNISIIKETAPPSMEAPPTPKPKPKMHSMPKGKGKMPRPFKAKPVRKAFKSKHYFSPTMGGAKGISSLRAKAGVDKLVRVQIPFDRMVPGLAPFVCAEALGYYQEAGLVVKVSYGATPLETLTAGKCHLALTAHMDDALAQMEGSSELQMVGVVYPGGAPCGQLPLVTRREQLDERAAVLNKFMRATEEGVSFCADHPEWGVELLRDHGLRMSSDEALERLRACIDALDGGGVEPRLDAALAPATTLV